MTLFLLTVLLVVAIHEFGHYTAFRLFKVPVTDFAIGFGTTLISYKPFTTRFHLKVLPLGGYVKADSEIVKTLPEWKKIVVALAGPAINILPATLLAIFIMGNLHILPIMGKSLWLIVNNLIDISLHPIDYLQNSTHLKEDVHHVSKSYSNGIMFLWWFLSVSIFLGLTNLLPIAPLDGYHVLRESLYMIAGKAKTDKYLNIYGIIGLLWILYLMVLTGLSFVVELFH